MQVALLQRVCQRSSYRTCRGRPTLVLRVSRITHNIDVAVVREFTLLSTSDLLIAITTTVPQFAVQFANRIILAESGERVLNIPLSTRTLESMTPDLCPRHFFAIGCRKESDNCKPVTRLVQFRFPKTLISATTLRRLVEFFDLSWSV